MAHRMSLLLLDRDLPGQNRANIQVFMQIQEGERET
jgi:hypothetical protein